MTFPQFAWRFFTGAHLDGVARSNATWFRRGTTPSDRLTWWTAKSRFSRMMWRWGFIAVPVVVRIVYADAPVIRVNLVLFIAAVYGPFLSWRIAIMVIARIPRVRVVTIMVPHDLGPFQQNPDIDEVVDAIPVQELEEKASDLTDMDCTPDLDEIEKLLKKRGTRRD